MVVCKFGVRDVFDPRSWVISAVHPQVGFDFLIHMFSFSIGLWVISGGEGKVISEDSSKFLHQQITDLGTGSHSPTINYSILQQ